MTDPAPVELRIVSQPRYLCVARAAIGTAVRRLGFSDEEAGKVEIAVDEALSNIMRHSYGGREDGPIHLRFEPLEHDGKSGFRLVIEDEGRQVDPRSIRGRSLDDIRPGGLGVNIIHAVMDEVSFSPRPEQGMRLVMIKYATPDAQAKAPKPTPEGRKSRV